MCKAYVSRRLCLDVEGLEHVPEAGPLLIAARHYHHLYDGCVLLATVPRPLQILVGLDWVQDRRTRGLMEALCNTGRWPAVLRRDRLGHFETPSGSHSAYRPEEGGRYLRRALRMSSDLFREGRALLVFPEAYPNVDPVFTPKAGDDDFLPFREGFAKLVRLAQRSIACQVPVIPAGLEYHRGKRYHVTLRFGAPQYLDPGHNLAAFAADVETQVRQLSGLTVAPAAVTVGLPAFSI